MVHSHFHRAGRWLGRNSRPGRRALPASVGVAVMSLVLVLPLQAAAQDITLNELERSYRLREQDHRTAVAARQAELERLIESIDAIGIAREGGDAEAIEAAMRAARQASDEVHRLQGRVTLTRERLEGAREAYFAALQQRLLELDDQRRGASGEELARIDALQNDIIVELNELAGQVVVQPVSFSIPIELDPRDDVPEIRTKIRLVERRLEEADSLIALYDRQIEGLESIVQDAQRRADFIRGVRIFGDDLPPTGGDAQAQNEREALFLPQDTTAAGEPLGPEEQLQSLRNARMLAESYREEIIAKREEFLAAIRGRRGVPQPEEGW